MAIVLSGGAAMKVFKSIHFRPFVINLSIFLIFSETISLIFTILPRRMFDYTKWFFRDRKWENGGEIYQKVFKIKVWKKLMPELSDFLKFIFPKRHIKAFNRKYLSDYLSESCRAELTHWNIFFSSFLFSFWTDTIMTAIFVFIAFILNMPFIIMQRYNRPRIIKLVREHEKYITVAEYSATA